MDFLAVNVFYPFSITFVDFPNPEKHALLVYFMGCSHKCLNCQNPQFKDYNYRISTKILKLRPFLNEIDTLLLKNKTNKIVFSGGDPLHPNNLTFVTNYLLIKQSTIGVCIYTGYDIEYVKQNNVKGFEYIKCGKYDWFNNRFSEKTDEYIKFSSTNQKLYDSDYNLISSQGIYYFKNT